MEVPAQQQQQKNPTTTTTTTTTTPTITKKKKVSHNNNNKINAMDFQKSLKNIAGDLKCAKTKEEIIETLQKISSLIQSCPRLLVTHAKIEKWQKFIDINSLLTPEVVSSFDVLQAEITVLTNQHEKEKKRFIELKNSLEKKIKDSENSNETLVKKFTSAKNELTESAAAYKVALAKYEEDSTIHMSLKKVLELHTKTIVASKEKVKFYDTKICFHTFDDDCGSSSSSSSIIGKKRKNHDADMKHDNVDDGSSSSSSSSSRSTRTFAFV